MMSDEQRLHPAAIIFNFFKTVKETILAIIPLGLFSLNNISTFYVMLIVAGVILFYIGYSILSWYRYTYHVEGDELRIEHGVFVRKKRYISKNRIQSIDLTANVIHRVLKLVKVEIETAGTGISAEASLKAVKLTEGEQLREILKTKPAKQAGNMQDSLAKAAGPKRRTSFKHLFIAGSTSGSIGVILALFWFLFSQLEQFIPEKYFDNTVEWVTGLSIIFIVAFVIFLLIVLWLAGIAGTIIKYGNFTIMKNDDELFITRGLLEKKQLTIPLKRIQAVGIQESIVRQPLGYATIFAEVAGGSFEKGKDYSTILFPIMKVAEAREFLETFVPDYPLPTVKKTPLSSRAWKYYIFKAAFPFIIIAAAIAYFFPQFIWAAAILLAASAYIGFLRYKDGGYHLDGDRLTIQYRTFSKFTVIMYHKRIQAFEKKQHKLQKVQQLASIKLSIMGSMGLGSHYKIRQFAESDIDELADWYSYRK